MPPRNPTNQFTQVRLPWMVSGAAPTCPNTRSPRGRRGELVGGQQPGQTRKRRTARVREVDPERGLDADPLLGLVVRERLAAHVSRSGTRDLGVDAEPGAEQRRGRDDRE